MNKRLIIMVCSLAFSLAVCAQASGGQITRKRVPSKKTAKRVVSSKKESPVVEKDEQRVPPIQPTSINELYTYNVVVSTMGIIENARGLCQSLRDRGYPSQIYWDGEKGLYRIIISGTNNEQDALAMKATANKTYPGTWILYVVNGKE